MTAPDVSVIVPVYNVEKYLKECVDSLLAQTLDSLEIILVNDGSKDSSGRLCDEFAAAHPDKIRVFHIPNGGAAAARNVGIDNARGQFIGFVDSDDIVAPDMYEDMRNAMIEQRVDVVASTFKDWEHSQKVRKCRTTAYKGDGLDFLEKFLTGEVDRSPCTKLYRRAAMGEFKFPTGRTHEDFPFLCQVFLQPVTAYILPKAHYMYRMNPASVTSSALPHFADVFANIEMVDKIIPHNNAAVMRAYNIYVLQYHIISGIGIVRRRLNSRYKDLLRINRRYIRSHWRLFFDPLMTNRWCLKAIYAFLHLP